MIKIQLTLFDPIVAEKHHKAQKQAELDAFALSIRGPAAFKRRKQKKAKRDAALVEARKHLCHPVW